jgi:hypothetical protein
MNKLNTWQNAIFLIGSVLMVVGAGLNVLLWPYAPYLYAVGAIGFTSMQMLQRYDGNNTTIRRLRRIMLLSDFLFLASAVLMFANQSNSFGISQITYMQYIKGKWVGTLMLAAIIQLFVTHRIDHELKKEN